LPSASKRIAGPELSDISKIRATAYRYGTIMLAILQCDYSASSRCFPRRHRQYDGRD